MINMTPRALLIIFFVSSVDGTCTTNIPNCWTYSKDVQCSPISPSVPHFFGQTINGCEKFKLSSEWTLSYLPQQSFKQFQGLKQITLSNAGIRYLECDIFHSMKETLETLSLVNNLLSEIPICSFQNLTSLKKVQLSQNFIAKLDQNAFGVEERNVLKHIDLSRNRITSIHGKSFSKLNSLEYLDLSNNNLTETFWESVRGLSWIKTLLLANNDIDFIDISVLNDLSELEDLDLSHNSIQSVSGIYLRSGVMRDLNLKFNGIHQIHNDFISITKTFSRSTSWYVDFSNNQLSSLHLNVPECKGRCNMHLQNNQLSSLTFSQVSGSIMYTINVSNNNIESISDSFPFARYYYLSHNPLSTDSAINFMVSKLRHAYGIEMTNTSLFCSNKTRTVSSMEVINLTEAENVRLDQNCLNEDFVCLMKSFSSAKMLHLNFDKNEFSSFPGCINKLLNTFSVSLKYNRILLFNYTNPSNKIHEIDFEGNHISRMPPKLTMLTMKNINLKLNQVSDIPHLKVEFQGLHRFLLFPINIIDLSYNTIGYIENIIVIHNYGRYTGRIRFRFNLSNNALKKLPNVTDIYTIQESSSIYAKYSFENTMLADLRPINMVLQEDGQMIDLTLSYSQNAIENVSQPLVHISGYSQSTIAIVLKLDISFNSLSSYPSCKLVEYQYDKKIYLREIRLSHNQLTIMPDMGYLHSCYISATSIFLNENRIRQITNIIGNGQLHPIDVYNLYLSNNLIDYVVDYAFKNLKSLRRLDLSSNKLTVLPVGLDQMKFLNILDISNNNIVHINPITFVPNQNIRLKNNPIECTCSISWLRNYTLQTDDTLCVTPNHFRGYLVTCFPIDHCKERYNVHVTKKTIQKCSTEGPKIYFDIALSYTGDSVTVSWTICALYDVVMYQVILRGNGEVIYRSDVLKISKYIFEDSPPKGDEICVLALNDTFNLIYEKCIRFEKHKTLNSSNYQESNKTDSLMFKSCANYDAIIGSIATIASLSICGHIILVVLKYRRVFRNSQKKTTDADKEHTCSNNPLALENLDKPIERERQMSYERRYTVEPTAPVYEGIF